MARKNKIEKPFELTMLDDSLDRLAKIGARQPLPNRHFYKEAAEIMHAAVVAAYKAGLADGKNSTESFPLESYEPKK